MHVWKGKYPQGPETSDSLETELETVVDTEI